MAAGNGTAAAAMLAERAASVVGKRALSVVQTDVTEVSQVFAIIGWFIVCYGLISYVVKERLYLSEPLIATTVGIITGPYVLNWIDPSSWGGSAEEQTYITYQFSRLVIGVQVLFCGIALPARYLRKNAGSLAILLILVMACAWFITALLVWALIPGLTFLESLCLASAITPTDPVLANSITKGRFAEKHVPAALRNLIVAESGFNDGMGVPFLFLSLYLMRRLPGNPDEGLSVGQEIGRWAYATVIYQVLISCLYGALVGYLARKSLRWAEERMYIDKDNFLSYGLGLALFTIGTTGMFGSDDLLAAFVAGNSFTWDDWFRIRTEDEAIQDILDALLNTSIFLYIGAIIDWNSYWVSNNPLELNAWRVVVLAIGVLLLRRPPVLLLLMRFIPSITTFKDGLFMGWFGPIGVSALFYVAVALRPPEEGGIPEGSERLREVYQPVVLFIIFASILGHGITVPISKLGPHLVSRTTTLTKTRSISFFTSSRPGSRPGSQPNTRVNTLSETEARRQTQQQPSISDELVAAKDKMEHSHPHHGKELWNPLLSLYDGVVHVLLFWRKDSFWRKEPTAAGRRHAEEVRHKVISAPTDPHLMQRSILERPKEQAQSSDANAEDGSDGIGEQLVGASRRNVAFAPQPSSPVSSSQEHSSDAQPEEEGQATEAVASRPSRRPAPALELPTSSRPSTPPPAHLAS